MRDSGEPKRNERGWIFLDADESFTSTMLLSIRADLAAGLPDGIQGVRLRDEANTGGRGAALVFLRHDGNGRFTIEIADHLTRKRLARDIDWKDLPSDGRSLALAVAIGELLRASWAELDVAPEPLQRPVSPSRAPAEPEPEKSVVSSGVQPLWSVEVRPAWEWWSAGQTFLGADVAFSVDTGRLRFGLRVGARQGISTPTAGGTIDAVAATSAATAAFDLAAHHAWYVGPQVGVHGGMIRFAGRPSPNYEATRLEGVVVTIRSGATLGHQWGNWTLGADAAVGAPLATLSAQLDGVTATGAAGIELAAGLWGKFSF